MPGKAFGLDAKTVLGAVRDEPGACGSVAVNVGHACTSPSLRVALPHLCVMHQETEARILGSWPWGQVLNRPARLQAQC